MTDEYATIAAISTPPGEGGIGIIRISGKNAETIGRKCLRKKDGANWGNWRERHVYFGTVVNEREEIIDEAIFFLFRQPRSYTREDLLEIQVHGNSVVLEEILNQVIASGARLAEPGEFTKRAFLNGRIDLSQAEAVIDLIRARNARGGRVAANILTGELRQKVEAIKGKLLYIVAEIEASLDYPEDDIEITQEENRLKQLREIKSEIQRMLDQGAVGQILHEGLTVVLTGRPNVGKSSILNALMKQERAIVTDIPGTTRDVLIEDIELKGVPVRLVDTAGIHASQNPVEQIGIEKAQEWLEKADLVLLILEAGRPVTQEDINIFEKVKEKNLLIVVNKTDQPLIIQDELVKHFNDYPVKYISALTKQGLDELETEMFRALNVSVLEPDHEILITRTRHRNALVKCLSALCSAEDEIRQSISDDLVVITLRSALKELLVITGEDVSESIIEEIFSSFCIGK